MQNLRLTILGFVLVQLYSSITQLIAYFYKQYRYESNWVIAILTFITVSVLLSVTTDKNYWYFVAVCVALGCVLGVLLKL